MTDTSRFPEATIVTTGPNHHFFGYYDKSPWDASGGFLLGMETDFMDRVPTPDDVLSIGLIDLEDGNAWRPLGESHAWCWQPGCMLQWLETDPGRLIVHNDRRGDRFVAVIRDVWSGEERVLPHPVHAVSRDGRSALTINFSRLDDMRPGYGYCGLEDPHLSEAAPADDGIHFVDLGTGETRFIISYAQVADFEPEPGMEGRKHWMNHFQFNPSDTRFLFLHRWAEADERGKIRGHWKTRMFTANPDGSELHLFETDGLVSHFDWRDDETILVWAGVPEAGRKYFLFTDRTQESEAVGEDVLTHDGHCSYSPDRRWILTDTYPDKESTRTLILYHPGEGKRVDIGRFFSPPELKGPFRCDLHPRWSRDGGQVCIDSAHEGTRQMYVLDVSSIVEGSSSVV